MQLRMRVGDAERDACVAALIDHHLHGRLSVEELDRRQRSALAAVTTDDLRPLLADLPDREALATPAARPASPAVVSDVAATAGHLLVRVTPVLGGAWVAQGLWQYSAEGPFLGALVGGALGYATHAVVSRFRR